jgi:hypothetical protein
LNKEFEGKFSPGPASSCFPYSDGIGGALEPSKACSIKYSFGGKEVERNPIPKQVSLVRILVLFYTVNFTTYSSKVDYTILTLVPRQDTIL